MTIARFRDAQDAGGSFDAALAELRAGEKHGHWIWWTLPCLRGLGRSKTSVYYGIVGDDEAVAYLRDDVLRRRLLEAVSAIHAHVSAGVPLLTVMGSDVDVLKTLSCLTLFAPLAERLGGDEAARIATLAREIIAAHDTRGSGRGRET